jgi:ubiquinone/menaquinone biosynthesis C-methylase UbiE
MNPHPLPRPRNGGGEKTRAQAQATYDRLSGIYDLLAGGSERRFLDLGLRQLNPQPGEAVLEVGSGTGHGLASLACAVGPAGRAWGIDLSPRMCRVAHDRAPQAGVLCGDAVELPFGPRTFDAVLMCFTLELFDTPEIPAVLGECGRVLRSGGRMCVVALSRRRVTAMVRLYEWAHVRWPAAIDCRPIDVQGALEAAGLETVDVRLSSMWGLPVGIVVTRQE